MEHDRYDADFTRAEFTREDDDLLEAGRERAWRMLDHLPKGEAHPSLAATTIEMSAAGPAAGREPWAASARWRRRVIAAVVLSCSLTAGFVAGSRVKPLPDDPLAAAVGRHIAVLAEAGSVEFLRRFSARDIPPPRRRGGPRSEADNAAAPEPYPALDDAIEDFRAALAAPPSRVSLRPDAARQSMESLPPAAFQAAMDTALALADPGAEPLVEAARRWHQWVLASDPVERRILPTLGTKERLEWLARRGRPFRRPREFPRETRGPGG